MTDIVPYNERKKAAIEAVREGKPIQIYETKPVLKEGDALTDWHTDKVLSDGTVTTHREVVGSLIVERFLWEKSTHNCPYCETPMHMVRKEVIRTRTGRNGKKYSIEESDESQYRGRICPLCEYRDNKQHSYSY